MANGQSGRASGWWYPWVFVAAMVLVFVVNGAMAYLAVDTFTGVETEHQYQKGIRYNDALAGAEKQAELGWKLDFGFVADAPSPDRHGGTLNLVFTGSDGRPLDDLDVRLRLIRPVTEGYDSQSKAVAGGDGHYGNHVDLPLPGLWEVRVNAYRGSDVYQMVHRIRVP